MKVWISSELNSLAKIPVKKCVHWKKALLSVDKQDRSSLQEWRFISVNRLYMWLWLGGWDWRQLLLQTYNNTVVYWCRRRIGGLFSVRGYMCFWVGTVVDSSIKRWHWFSLVFNCHLGDVFCHPWNEYQQKGLLTNWVSLMIKYMKLLAPSSFMNEFIYECL